VAKKQGQYATNLELSHYGPEVKQMMDEATHCLYCGVKLSEAMQKDARRNRGYYCLKHYYTYPPKLAYVALAYKMKPEKVIVSLLNKTNNVTVTAHMLGVEKPALYDWMRKLGIKRVVRWEAIS
jgi:transposase-like protein